jgi:predicted transcriptional regulator
MILTENEFLIMLVFWNTQNKLSVGDVFNSLNTKKSRSTIVKTIRTLHKKKMLNQEKWSYGKFYYYAAISQQDYEKKLLEYIQEEYFLGHQDNFLSAVYRSMN